MNMMAFGMNLPACLIQGNRSSPQTFASQQPMPRTMEGFSQQKQFLRVSPRRKQLQIWNSKERPDTNKHNEL
jgi:hypothetical protein